MALTINYNGTPKPKPTVAPAPVKAPNGQKAWDAIFVLTGSALMLKKLWKEGVATLYTDKELIFASKAGLLVHSAPLSSEDVETLKKFSVAGASGLAPPALITLLKKAMNDAFLKFQTSGVQLAAGSAAGIGSVSPDPAPDEPVSLGSAAAKVVEVATSKDPVVKLRNATKMYQLVNGSESTSRYVVVAFTDDMKFAARLSGATLSIRVEGPGLNKHAPRLKNAGFSKFESDYASVHLKTMGDKVLAGKALGAVLSGLAVQGIKIETPWPDVNQCEKGQ